MDSLIAQGCDKFVFDLRNNPGGATASAVAVISTLLQKGDLIYSTKDYSGEVTYIKAEPVIYNPSSDYVTCNVTEKDIGKYSDYEMIILANKNSVSVAEIFISALRDHEKAEVVGVKTYGKGCVQNIITLSNYGEEYIGGLRLTTKLFYPPSGVSFNNGIGIEPDHYVELEGIAAEIHFLKLTEDVDNQLQKAISLLIEN
jgi:carboxyl-terminal processing protease